MRKTLIGILAFVLMFHSTFTSAKEEFDREINENQIKNAVFEINTSNVRKPPFRKKKDIENLFEEIFTKLLPSAEKVCFKYLGEKSDCKWNVKHEDVNIFNAYASGKNNLTFYSGLARNIYHKEELAFVVAHEIGHHLGNHVRSTKARVITGLILGGLLGAATGSAEITADAAQTGAYLGSRMYSAKQEYEADLISIEILHKAGFDLAKARDIHIRMTGIGANPVYSGFLSSHPSGPERLIMFDRAVNFLEE